MKPEREEDKEAEREKDRGKGDRKRGNPCFFFQLPGVVSSSKASKRDRIHVPATMKGTHRGCCYQCVCVWWGCSFKQAFEWPNCIGIQQSESWLRSRRAAGGVSARTSTATLSKRAPAQSTQLMLSLSLTLSPLFVLSYFSLILLLLTPIPSSLALLSLSRSSLPPQYVVTHPLY